MAKLSAGSSSDNNIDPLLECLVYLTHHYERPQSAQSIIASIPYTEKGMGPELFCETAQKLQFRTKINKRDLHDIPDEVLPVTLILNDNQSIVLLNVNKQKAEIFNPKSQKKGSMDLTEIEKIYAGYAIFIQPFSEQRRHKRHWFWGVIRDNRATYRKVAIAALLINIFALTGPLFIMNVYDRVIPNNAIETGWVLGIAALTIFGFDFIMRSLRGFYIDLSGRKIDVIVARKIYDQVMNIKMAGKPGSSGAFANMLREFETVRDFCTSATMVAIIDMPFSLLFVFVIYILTGPIALILLAIMVIVAGAGFLLQIPLKALIRDSMETAEAKHGLLIETINGLETIKTLGADGRMRARYGDYVGASASVNQTSRFFSSMAQNIASFCQQSASIIIVLFGMYMVQDGELTMGALIATVILGGRAIAPIGQVAALITRYHTAKGSLATLEKVMNAPVERPADKKFLHRPDLKGNIQFDRVDFTYPHTNKKILDQLSFDIKAGEKVGIIGRIGSGKSTLAKLMTNLYDPHGGDIYVDQTDYQQIDPADLRRNIGYISQETLLFTGSIRDNIAAGLPQATDEQVLTASKAASVHDFVMAHPMGYDAPVGERGNGLSGGQKQCIALARALITNPQILLMDEPTNDMDVQAEANFIDLIRKQSKDKTLILITHRQSLLPLVDRLIVIEGGKAIIDGPRDKVLAALSGQGDQS